MTKDKYQRYLDQYSNELNNIAERRQWTQGDIAAITQTSQSTVSRWMRKRSVPDVVSWSLIQDADSD